MELTSMFSVLLDAYLGYHITSIVIIAVLGLAAIAAIVLVMLTPGNSQGIDALGGSSETFYGKNKGKSSESKLKIATMVCLGVIAVLAIVLCIIVLFNKSIFGLI